MYIYQKVINVKLYSCDDFTPFIKSTYEKIKLVWWLSLMKGCYFTPIFINVNIFLSLYQIPHIV
jgi:hypothetical protein